jgi:hypothetical protein
MKYKELPTPLRIEVKKIADDMGSSFEIDKEEFQKKVTPTFYHGTTRQGAEGIRKEGLKISKRKPGVSGVYMTTSKEDAISYSQLNEPKFPEEQGRVFEVNLPKEYYEDAVRKRKFVFPNGEEEEISLGRDIPKEYLKEISEPPAPEVLEKFEPEEYNPEK